MKIPKKIGRLKKKSKLRGFDICGHHFVSGPYCCRMHFKAKTKDSNVDVGPQGIRTIACLSNLTGLMGKSSLFGGQYLAEPTYIHITRSTKPFQHLI